MVRDEHVTDAFWAQNILQPILYQRLHVCLRTAPRHAVAYTLD